MNNRDNKESGNLVVLMAISSFFVMIIVGITLLVGLHYNSDKRGTFGDMFGFANALFTGLSFIGLIGTILLQRKDLNTQRKELREQTDLVHKQNFENSFFQLLSMYNSIVNNMSIESMKSTYKGRHAFTAMADTFQRGIVLKVKKGKLLEMDEAIELIKKIDKEEIVEEFDKFYELHKEYLGYYFASFYHIINYIHITNNIDKEFYISIARSQLSSFELILLFYYGLSKAGKEKMFTLIKTYDVIHDVDYNLMYNKSAKSYYY